MIQGKPNDGGRHVESGRRPIGAVCVQLDRADGLTILTTGAYVLAGTVGIGYRSVLGLICLLALIFSTPCRVESDERVEKSTAAEGIFLKGMGDSHAREAAPSGINQLEPSDPKVDSYARLRGELKYELRQIEVDLTRGEVNESTESAQEAAIDRTQQLINLLKKMPRKANNTTASGSDSGTATGETGESGDVDSSEAIQYPMNEGEVIPSLDSRDPSEDEAASGVSTQSSLELRSEVVGRSWGHLPERIRLRILNGGDQAALPQYQSLMHDYYESLSTTPTDTRGSLQGRTIK